MNKFERSVVKFIFMHLSPDDVKKKIIPALKRGIKKRCNL